MTTSTSSHVVDEKELDANSQSVKRGKKNKQDSFGRKRPKASIGKGKKLAFQYMQLRKAIKAELSAGTKSVIPGFVGDVVTQEDVNYDDVKHQYATTSYPAADMSPFLICYPVDEKDISIALEYAQTNGKKVVIRSGGHQYSGLSSGNKDHIVIDMLLFNGYSFDATNANILTAGVTTGTETLTLDILVPNRLSLPLAVCNHVNLGGYIQSGGYGNFMRCFGLVVDRVIGFRIVFADGSAANITKPTADNNSEIINGATNDDIFWAVLGGNPGSFGIIVSWTLDCIKDDDYPKSVGVQWTFAYTRARLERIMDEMSKLAAEALQNTIPADYDFMLTIKEFDDVPGFAGILFEGVYGNVSGTYDPTYFQRIYDAAKDIPMGTPELTGEVRPLSEILKEAVKILPGGREFPQPFKKSLRGAIVEHQPGFVVSYVNQLDAAVSNRNLRLISQVQIGGGAAVSNEPSKNNLPGDRATSISHRDMYFGLSFDVFYEFGYEVEAQKIQDTCQQAWVTDGLFSAQDIRLTWGTFGSTKIDDVWQFYYDNEVQYNKLREIKAKVDPKDIFSNEFTIPPKVL